MHLSLRRRMLLALALAGCASSGERLSTADRELQEQAFGSALGRYREVADADCEGDEPGSATRCCRALVGQGRSYLGLGERQAAVQALTRARQLCPTDLEVRRRLYEAQQPAEPDVPPTPRTIPVAVEYVVDAIPAEVRIVWAAVFLGGEPVGREALNLVPGTQQADADLVLEVTAGKEKGRRIHLVDTRPFPVSPRGLPEDQARLLRVNVAREPGLPSLAAALRLRLSVEALTPIPTGPPAGATPEQAVTYARQVGFALRESGQAPKLPPELRKRGPGWSTPLTICVAAAGTVDRVRFPAPAAVHDPSVDAAILEAVRRWRYGLFKWNGQPQGYCHEHTLDLASGD